MQKKGSWWGKKDSAGRKQKAVGRMSFPVLSEMEEINEESDRDWIGDFWI